MYFSLLILRSLLVSLVIAKCCILTASASQCDRASAEAHKTVCKDAFNYVCRFKVWASLIGVTRYHYDEKNDVYRGICWRSLARTGDYTTEEGIGIHWDCKWLEYNCL